MKYETLIFDLDGTISDPATGFVRSINYALNAHDFEERSEESLHAHIGPPLDQSFRELCQTDDETLVASLVASYRERYGDVGCTEVEVYPEIPGLLSKLAGNGQLKLAICSSKRVDFVERTLDGFDLLEYFDVVSGGEIGTEKTSQLAGLLASGAVSAKSLMIGDRYFDLVAASTNGLPGAGVLWGYGSRQELEKESPAYLFESPPEIAGVL